jgi:hypothetical protein
VLGTPIGTDAYLKDFVAQNSIKIMKDVEKLEPLSNAFTHFQLVKMTMNTCKQYMSANVTLPPQERFLSVQHIHVDKTIAKTILQKGTRGSFHHWVEDDYDLAVTMQVHAPEASCSRWFRSDSECPCSNCCQGRYGIPIPEIGRILTSRGTTTLAPESNSSGP